MVRLQNLRQCCRSQSRLKSRSQKKAMSDILSEYGNDSGAGQVGRATNGGQQEVKPIPYSPPTGRGGSTKGPGLGGTNHGNCGTQGKR
jgi:hypothetical protein